MPAVRRTKTMELVWDLHQRLYRLSRGRLGTKFGGMPILILTTTGRKSGEARPRALMSMPHGDDGHVVVASNAGEPKHPAWYRNLRDNPDVVVEQKGRERPMRARVAEGPEREEIWRQMLEVNDDYATYQERAGEREIPIVVLEPRG